MLKLSEIILLTIVTLILTIYQHPTNSQTVPPRACNNTGPTCVEECPDETENYYQWCGSCTWYIYCYEGVATFTPCEEPLIFNDVVKMCSATSPVCDECYIHTPAPPTDVTVPPSTTPAPAVPSLCESTGPVCVSSCHETINGAYQWCGRCDYYLACSGGLAYYMPCATNYFWDNDFDRCQRRSYTCVQCVEYITTTTTTTTIRPDSCSNEPCQNGATCVVDGDSYACVCSPGFTDSNCQTDIDECESDPCLNNATCVDSNNSYSCHCLPGYTGSHCDTELLECSSDPCMNGATCVDGSVGYSCICLPGYSGANCQTDIDECATLPCDNSGTCVDGVNGYTCTCSPGFTGTNCQTAVDPCISDPCLNNATCVSVDNEYTCLCLIGFTGTMCETDIDECVTSPCQNGGTCVDGINGFTCICPPGYTGSNCQQDIDECDSDPCRNNATCVSGVNGYTCHCKEGFAGQQCEVVIDHCYNVTCLNGATCISEEETFHCVCPPEFTGIWCELGILPPVVPECGSLLATYTNDTSRIPRNFSIVCYLERSKVPPELIQTPCLYLLQDLPRYGNASELLRSYGNFGCWIDNVVPPNQHSIDNACFDNYQHDYYLGMCSSCPSLTVCIRFPQW